MKNKFNKLSEEFVAFKKDQENSPISIVRVLKHFFFGIFINFYFLFQNELNEKNREIKDLKKEIEKINQLKEEYKDYYEKMRNGCFN